MNATIKTINLMNTNNLECTILQKFRYLPKSALHLLNDYELDDEGLIISEVTIYRTFKNGKCYAILKKW